MKKVIFGVIFAFLLSAGTITVSSATESVIFELVDKDKDKDKKKKKKCCKSKEDEAKKCCADKKEAKASDSKEEKKSCGNHSH